MTLRLDTAGATNEGAYGKDYSDTGTGTGVDRYTLGDDRSRLSYEMTITDSGTFVGGPAIVEGHWVALGETPEPYDCKIDE